MRLFRSIRKASQPLDIKEEKAVLRALAKARRETASARMGAQGGEALAGHAIGFAAPFAGAVVSGFSSIGDEIDVRPLMRRLHGEGYRLALPVIAKKAHPLVFRAWAPGEPLVARTWGIEEPADTAPVVVPDVVLVPLLAFDAGGYRIGYGGGFYDRSLAEIRAAKPAIAIGVAYDEQRVDAVPTDTYDEPLDWVLTPSGPIRCRDE